MGENFGQVMVQVKTEPPDPFEFQCDGCAPRHDSYGFPSVKLEPVDRADDESEQQESHENGRNGDYNDRASVSYSHVTIKTEPVDYDVSNGGSDGREDQMSFGNGRIKQESPEEDDGEFSCSNGHGSVNHCEVRIKTEPKNDYISTESRGLINEFVGCLGLKEKHCNTVSSNSWSNVKNCGEHESPELRRILSQPCVVDRNYAKWGDIPDSSLGWISECLEEDDQTAWERQINESKLPPVDRHPVVYDDIGHGDADVKPSVVRSLLTAPLSSFPQHRKRKVSFSRTGEEQSKRKLRNGKSFSESMEKSNFTSPTLEDHINSTIKSLLQTPDSMAIVPDGFDVKPNVADLCDRSSKSKENPLIKLLLNSKNLKSAKKSLDNLSNDVIDPVTSLIKKEPIGPSSTSNGESSVIRSLLKAPLVAPASGKKPRPSSTRPTADDKSRDQSKIRSLLTAPLPPRKQNLSDKPTLMNLLTEPLPKPELNLTVSLPFSKKLRNLLTNPPSKLIDVDDIGDESVKRILSEQGCAQSYTESLDEELQPGGVDNDDDDDSAMMTYMCFECGDEFSSRGELSFHKDNQHGLSAYSDVDIVKRCESSELREVSMIKTEVLDDYAVAENNSRG